MDCKVHLIFAVEIDGLHKVHLVIFAVELALGIEAGEMVEVWNYTKPSAIGCSITNQDRSFCLRAYDGTILLLGTYSYTRGGYLRSNTASPFIWRSAGFRICWRLA